MLSTMLKVKESTKKDKYRN